MLTTSGGVYSDRRSIQDVPQSVLDAVQAACGSLVARAPLNPKHEPPAPPQLVQARVHAGRVHPGTGLPNDADPSAKTRTRRVTGSGSAPARSRQAGS